MRHFTRHPSVKRKLLSCKSAGATVKSYRLLILQGIIFCLLSAACFEFKPGIIPDPFEEQNVSSTAAAMPFSTIPPPLAAAPDLLQNTVSTPSGINIPEESRGHTVSAVSESDAYRRIALEALYFTIPEGWSSCANIAAYFGIPLEDLYAANPGILQYGRCIIHTGQVLEIPPVEVLSPVEYVRRYECVPSGNKDCLQPDDSLEVMVAHTLFGEGGSSMGPGSAANIMQVAINRMNNLLEHRGVFASDLSSEEYKQLLIHILAQPYRGAGAEHPAFNAFADPVPHPDNPAMFQVSSISGWQAALDIAASALENGNTPQWWSGTHAPDPRIADPANHVLYYCSGSSSNPPFDTSDYNRIVAFEERNLNTRRSQWYYYNSSQYCSW